MLRNALRTTPRAPIRLNLTRPLSTTSRILNPSLDTTTSSTPSTPTPPFPSTTPSKTSKAAKAEGSIASVFATLSGGTLEDALPDRFAQLKRSLISSPAHAEHLKRTWRDVLSSLSQRVEETAALGGSCIPEVEFPSGGKVGKLEEWTDKNTFENIKDRGVAVIRNVIPSSQVLQWKEEIQSYAKLNNAKGFPEDNPQVLELYWTPAQVAARSHPNLLTTSERFLQLFHKPSSSSSSSSSTVETACSLANPLTYVDRLRIRQPGDSKFALGAHIDGGGIERWECPHFLGLWSHILSPESTWTSHDPWSLGSNGNRMIAQTDMYGGPGQCGVFRPLQGWLSMSNTNAGEGTLKVLPFLSESTAYIILRPFFTPVKPQTSCSKSEFLHASNWTFDGETRRFPGCSLGHNIELDPATHPHLELERTMISIPSVNPGDMVLWHCDAVHSVESKHGGKGDSSVLYIPAIPTTKVNWEYVLEQRNCFERGVPPPDFPGGKGESEYKGRGEIAMVKGQKARRSLGLEKFDVNPARASEEEKRLLEWCNAQL
ncbi:related to DUF1479 domain protein [Ustilago trichophora]|uniref:Related to DUF1479 domain protein n=1 Tax=Ustilago trichophora TaxID=86804 RepID=A0A5C3DUM5_9BASI|nr:related to DUF1479 domain protein [Ustilago trichophora]